MRHIQRTALDLFDENGYINVTIERIAAVAEVSPSSIYRYFGTKEQLVLFDEYDPILFDALERELVDHDILTAMQNALSSSFRELLRAEEGFIRRRMRYAIGEPTVHAGMLQQVEETEIALRELFARYSRWSADDLELRIVAAVQTAALMATLTYWHETQYREPLDEVIDRTFARLAAGIRLD